MYWANMDFRFKTFSAFTTKLYCSSFISGLFLLHFEATNYDRYMDDRVALT